MSEQILRLSEEEIVQRGAIGTEEILSRNKTVKFSLIIKKK